MTEKTSHWKGQEGHPSPEKLAAYFEGELSPEENDEIQEHLVDCDLCTQALLDLKAFLDFPGEGSLREEVADLGAATEWRDLRRKIEEDRSHGRRPAATETPLRRFLVSPKTAYSLAALFAAATIGLSLYVQSLRQEQRSYDPNSRVVFLSEPSTTRGASMRPLILRRGKNNLVTFTLDLHGRSAFKGYWVVIYDSEGKQIDRRSGLMPQEDESIGFTVPSDRFREPGTYKFVLEAQGQSEPIGTYELEVGQK